MASSDFQLNWYSSVSYVPVLTHTAHSCIFIVATIMNVESVAWTVCDVRLQPCTLHVVQHNGTSASTIVGITVRPRSSSQETKLPAHNLQNRTSCQNCKIPSLWLSLIEIKLFRGIFGLHHCVQRALL